LFFFAEMSTQRKEVWMMSENVKQGEVGKLPTILRNAPRVILFDGMCNLCSRTLAFVRRNDTGSRYHLAWIQSPEGKEILRWCNLQDDWCDTMVVVEDGMVYFKSTAFLKVVRNLRFPWSLLGVGIIIPVRLRDWLYDGIALRRYRVFGKLKECGISPGGTGSELSQG
jgi:predicted DCC family thiol-disulfide oxidoreductase YuxK